MTIMEHANPYSPHPGYSLANPSIHDSQASLSSPSSSSSSMSGLASRHPPKFPIVQITPEKLKNRRKRTLARDKQILEQAYKLNTKPDKPERQRLVQLVNMNEKEVQIWFQNRRQNDRKKMQTFPLESTSCSDAVYGTTMPESFHHQNPSSEHHFDHARQASCLQTMPYSNGPDAMVRDPGAPRLSEPEPRRYLPSASRSDEGTRSWSHSPPGSSWPMPQGLRLSMSIEGKAEVVPNLPSPPRPSPADRLVPLLTHSRSEPIMTHGRPSPTCSLPPISTLTSSLPRDYIEPSRSRDVHAWEACAEEPRPDELTRVAEGESSGSAAAAISLMKSSGHVLQPSSRRNAPAVPRQYVSDQVKDGRVSKPSPASRPRVLGESGKGKGKRNSILDVSSLLTSDSDKENQSPSREAGSSWPPPANRDVEKFISNEVSPSKRPDAFCAVGLLALKEGKWR